MKNLNLGKYKAIVVSIALFLILDASVLTLNFYISFEIADDAVGVNLAGRQRMLSQRMVKSLMDIALSSDSENRQQALKELRHTVNLFEDTLLAFDRGGKTLGANNESVSLPKANTTKSQQSIAQAKEIWSMYKSKLGPVLSQSNDSLSAEPINQAVTFAKSNNLTLLKLMNDLTVELEGVAKSKATRLRAIQTIGISLAIINFFIILFHFLRQLRESDKRIEEARRETTEILDTVNEGLFLVDQSLLISSQHSSKLTSLFGKQSVANISFDDLLSDLVLPKDLDTAKRFIRLLFRQDIKSELIGDLNPISEIEVNIADEHGIFHTKYLSFDFSRVIEHGIVIRVLVTVNDVTDKVLLERELASTRSENEKQIEILTHILHSNPNTLRRFLESTFSTLRQINTILREPTKTHDRLLKKLNDIFIEVHNFKGEASALQLETFETLAHDFEESISELRKIPELNGNHFLGLTVQLDKLIRHTESVENLAKKLEEFSNAEGVKDSNSSNDWKHLYELCDTLSVRTRKKVELVASGLKESQLSEDLHSMVNEILIQFIRNAIVHGIETPEIRDEQSKPSTGRIDIRLAERPNGDYELCVKDDGNGFDYALIRKKAAASGKWSAEELESWDSKKLLSLIFEPGFSTAVESNLDAGRGVGMNVIMQKIQKNRGKIRIANRVGQGAQFLISLPAPLRAEAAA